MRASRLLLALPISLLSACHSNEMRIDGSSDEAFETTHNRLMESLTYEQKLRFTDAEIAYLRQFPCIQTKEPIKDSAFLNEFFGGQFSAKSCRRELDGKSYKDIMKLGANVPKESQR